MKRLRNAPESARRAPTKSSKLWPPCPVCIHPRSLSFSVPPSPFGDVPCRAWRCSQWNGRVEWSLAVEFPDARRSPTYRTRQADEVLIRHNKRVPSLDAFVIRHGGPGTRLMAARRLQLRRGEGRWQISGRRCGRLYHSSARWGKEDRSEPSQVAMPTGDHERERESGGRGRNDPLTPFLNTTRGAGGSSRLSIPLGFPSAWDNRSFSTTGWVVVPSECIPPTPPDQSLRPTLLGRQHTHASPTARVIDTLPRRRSTPRIVIGVNDSAPPWPTRV